MKHLSISSRWSFAIGTALVFPTFYFIVSSILKYGLGVNYFFDTAEPLLKSLGATESFGWNINLLILFGPVIAVLLNLLAVAKGKFISNAGEWRLTVSMEKKGWNIVIMLIGILCLATLFLYLIGENCNC